MKVWEEVEEVTEYEESVFVVVVVVMDTQVRWANDHALVASMSLEDDRTNNPIGLKRIYFLPHGIRDHYLQTVKGKMLLLERKMLVLVVVVCLDQERDSLLLVLLLLLKMMMMMLLAKVANCHTPAGIHRVIVWMRTVDGSNTLNEWGV